MHEAPQISAQLSNRVLLKREDMQKVRSSRAGSSVPQFPCRILLFRWPVSWFHCTPCAYQPQPVLMFVNIPTDPND